jgi:DMSO/TMAO reductase YedYZ heme-binding membrane subunit
MARLNLPDRRYLVWGGGLIIVAALPLVAGFTTLGWELSEILGLAATLTCLVLCACPVRPRQSRPPALLTLSRHEALGWIALGGAALHILIALVADHTVLEYLKLTAPLYQLAGIAAFILLLGMAAASVAASRRRLWRSHRDFQATHIGASCLLTALLAAHVITAGRYTGGLGRRLLVVAVAAGALAMLLRHRRGAAAPPQASAVRRLAFGRHSALVACIIAVTLVALTALVPSRAGLALREPVLARTQMLPLDFDHGKHVAVNCLVCHHNYADGRGFDACIHCHRSGAADIKVAVEARFHGFCLECHRNPGPRLVGHGPVSGCSTCHRVPGA